MPLLLILLMGALFRFCGLDNQSLWLDELHTMNEADPNISWAALFNQLKCCDPHPPLHFIITRLSFSLFGHTEMVARMVTAVAGTLSILVMYGLGKELKNKNLGLLAALLTSFNYYNVFYSQEARVYIFAFLFAALSFLFFIKLIKRPVLKTAILYAVATLGLLYSHYYSLFVVASQAVIAVVLLYHEHEAARKTLLKWFLVSAGIMIIGYLPWIPYLRATMNIKSFWIAETDHQFLQHYFSAYFGDISILMPFLVVLILLYVISVAIGQRGNDRLALKQDDLSFSFLMLVCWVFITMMIPYIRSVMTFPMLFPRYGIVILPALILAVAYGIAVIRYPVPRICMIVLVSLLSVAGLLWTKKYYSAIAKTQFREVTAFIAENNKEHYPIINEKTKWHQAYYLKHFKSRARLLDGRKEDLIDSILGKSSLQYDVNGFWIVGTHGDTKPADSILRNLDTAYTLAKETYLFDAWAQLYVAKNKKDYIRVGFNEFVGGAVQPVEKTLAIWNGSAQSRPVPLSKGKYDLIILARGDPGGDAYPHINIYMNDKKLGDYFVSGSMDEKKFVFELDAEQPVSIRIELDNDFYEPGKGDRNVFISELRIKPIK